MVKRVLVMLIFSVFFGSGVSSADSGVRALSMGGAFVGLADDAEAAAWNPAALGMLYQPEVNYTFLLSNQDEADYDHAFNLVYPLERFQDINWGVIGISFMKDIDKGLVDYESVLSLDSKLTRRSYGFSCGRKIFWEKLALGTSLRYVTYNSKLNKLAVISGVNYPDGSSDTDSCFAFDLAGYFRWNKFSTGILFQNVNEPKIDLYGTDIRYNLNIRPGAAYSPDAKTNYTIEIYDFSNTNQIRLGGEHWITAYLALRLGAYNLNKKENRALTFGCGLNSAEIFAYTDIEINYALLYWTDNPSDENDFSHFMGLKMKF